MNTWCQISELSRWHDAVYLLCFLNLLLCRLPQIMFILWIIHSGMHTVKIMKAVLNYLSTGIILPFLYIYILFDWTSRAVNSRVESELKFQNVFCTNLILNMRRQLNDNISGANEYQQLVPLGILQIHQERSVVSLKSQCCSHPNWCANGAGFSRYPSTVGSLTEVRNSSCNLM
jgi:hypothetical protein